MSFKVIIFIVLSFIATNTNAQNGFISFEKTRVDLGRIKEAQFPVTYNFEFLVAGSGQISITSVETDCACSVSEYTKEALASGERGKVKVIFNPYKAGPFQKTFIVIAKNAVPQKTELIIEGFIEPFTFEPSIEFPVTTKDSLAFKHKFILLGNITNKGLVKKEVRLYNLNADTIKLADTLQAPNFMDVAFDNGLEIPPKQSYSFSLFYDPESKNDFGEITDSLYLFKLNSDESLSTITLYVKSSIRQYFPENLSEDNPGNYPHLVVSDSIINLGRISLDSDRIVDFVLSNSGGSPLEIQKIVCNYGSEVYTIDKRQIDPYDFANLKIAVKDINKKGTQDRSILIYCNDPNNTVTSLKIKLYGQ
jgi:hypothetical protein